MPLKRTAMIKSINAFRIVFNFLLSLVELLIGVRFLVGLFGSSESVNDLVSNVRLTLEQMGYFASASFAGSGLEKSVTVLLLALGFMFFSFVMLTIVPGMTAQKEKELELAEDDDYD